jgi:tRNA pseudouridine38-40 synthase
MMQNYRITIEYDGTNYHGWQRQTDDRTIQGTIEAALSTMTGEDVALIGSGRTDAGVHALGQVANFRTARTLVPQAFQAGLNSLLHDDIVITNCALADQAFHARYDVKTKTYCYHILNRPLPQAIGRQYAWHIRKSLDLEAMRRATAHILGSHDFKAFEGTGSPRSNTIRRVERAQWSRSTPENLIFEIEADGFLRYMVRNLVGTLVDIGLGKKSSDDLGAILQARDRAHASATAPPHGLFLLNVTY